jgi:hypothetical protein
VTSVQENDIHIHTGKTLSPEGIGMACGKLSTCQGDGERQCMCQNTVGFDVDILNEPVYVHQQTINQNSFSV